MALAPGEARKDLSADALFNMLGGQFASLPDARAGEVVITLGDALMSAFAMFSLKDPSLLAFDHRRAGEKPQPQPQRVVGVEADRGDAHERPVELVGRDVIRGFVSRESAREDYGIEFDSNGNARRK